jgi:hypothetical protein
VSSVCFIKIFHHRSVSCSTESRVVDHQNELIQVVWTPGPLLAGRPLCSSVTDPVARAAGMCSAGAALDDASPPLHEREQGPPLGARPHNNARAAATNRAATRSAQAGARPPRGRCDGHPSRSRRVPALERAVGGGAGPDAAPSGRPTMSREGAVGRDRMCQPRGGSGSRQATTGDGSLKWRSFLRKEPSADLVPCRVQTGERGGWWMDCCELVDKVIQLIQYKKSMANESSPVVVPCHSIPRVRNSR